MANRTLTAVFDRYADAAAAVRRLEASGVAHDDIALVSNDPGHSQYYGAIPGEADPMPDGQHPATGAGASLGTLLGGGAGLLAGLGLLAVPGLGPVAAAVARIQAALDHDTAVPMAEREGAWREDGWQGCFVGRGAITGTPVFSDPTMLAPAAGAPAVPVPDLAEGEASGMRAAPPVVGIAGPGGGERPDAAPESRGDPRGRVRIYDRP